MDRRNSVGPDDWHPPDNDSGGGELRGDTGDKIGERPDRGGVARHCGMGKGEAEMSGEMNEASQLLEQLVQEFRLDVAEKERTESRAEVVRLRAENDGLRADLLRITAERDTDRLDLAQVRYERDGAMAALKEQHTANAALWEAQQEHQRKADHDQVIIEGLREALERTERLLVTAKSRQIPPALVGLLGVIRREAAAAEKMISQS